MRPLTVITGILLGSSVAITVSLAAVMTVFIVLGDNYPRLRSEFAPLASSLLVFSFMTIAAGLSFYTQVKNQPRWLDAHLLMWAVLIASVAYYWPA